jgi:hypothetical protein
MRHLHENARTVASIRLSTNRSTVIQVYQDRQGLLNDLMGPFSLHVTNEADATGVMLKLRVIESLFLG